MTTQTKTPVCCSTCVYMATHEKCHGKDGDCLHIPEDFEKMRAGENPPMRFRFWEEAEGPLQQFERLHTLQVEGSRNIVLGPGEAEVNALSTPQATSENLHRVAEDCGYMVGNLSKIDGEGGRKLIIWKDFGPFEIIWDGPRLSRILQGEEKEIFWKSEGVL